MNVVCRQTLYGRLTDNLKLPLCIANRSMVFKCLFHFRCGARRYSPPVKQTREILSVSRPYNVYVRQRGLSLFTDVAQRSRRIGTVPGHWTRGAYE
jgi:hypothetical protein